MLGKDIYSLPGTNFEERNNTLNTKHAVAQLVEALRYKPKGRGFDFLWFHCNFSFT